MRFVFWKVLLVLGLLSAGCLNAEQESEMRFECLDLSSGSFAMVPECETQEACYQKVESELFGFDDSQLDFESRRVLESYKNSLALSWRYFNEGQEELKKIRDLCWNKAQWNELPLHVNRFNQLIVGAFSAADAANQAAVIFLVSEKEWLAEQQLDLVREEPLFADWVLLQNNLNELQTKKTNGNSLAAKMLQTQERMETVFGQYGFGKRFVSSEQLADLLPENRVKILENLPQQEPFLPAFGGIIIDFAGRFANQQRLQESVQTLKRFPTFAFFSVYRELVGSSDSVAAETAVLARTLAEHHFQAEQKTNEWQEGLGEKIGKDREKIQGLRLNSLNGLPSETLQSLATALQMQSRIALKNFEISDWQESQPKMEQRLLEIQQEFMKMTENRVLGADSVGIRLNSLQQLENRLTEWESNLSFLENELRGGLLEACSERVRQLDKEAEKEFSEIVALELNAQTRFFAEEFGKSKEPIQKLSFCGQAIQASEKLSLFLQDQKKFEAETERTTGDCFAFLEIVFSSDGTVETRGLQWQWEQLQQKRKNSNVGIFELESDCQNLGQKTKNALSGNQKIIQLKNNFAESERYWNGILQLNWDNQSFSAAEKKVLELRKFFVNQQLLLEKAFPVLDTVLEQSEKLKEETREIFGEQLKSFLEKTVGMTSFAPETPKTNQRALLSTRLVFSNPTVITWEEPLAIEIAGKWSSVAATESDPVISTIFVQDQKLRILFSRVPTGISSALVQSERTVSTQEKNVFLFVNQFKALLQKTIRFETDSEFPALQVSTPVMRPDATNVWVIEKNREIPFSRNGSGLSFLLGNVSDKSTVSVFFTLPNPIQTTETVEQTENELHWSIEIQNRLDETIPKPQIVLAIPASGVSDWEAADESGNPLKITQSENEARIELLELAPHETKTIRATARVGNQQELLESVVSRTQKELEELAANQNVSIQQNAQKILAELLGEKKSLETVFRLANQALELKEKANRYRLDAEQFSETVSKTEQKISGLQKLVKSLKQQGYSAIGLELEQRISQSKTLLQQARASSENDPSLAASLSLRALAALEEGNTKNRAAFDLKQKETKKKALEIESLIQELLPQNPQAAEQQQKIRAALLSLEKSAWETNPAAFLQQLADTNTVLGNAEQTINELVKAKATETQEKIGQFRSLVSGNGLESRNNAMLEWLVLHPENEAVQAGILLPFRKTDLEKRQQEITGMVSQKLETALMEFETLFQQEKFAEALQKFSKNESGFTKALQAAEALRQEIDADWQAMRQKAGIALEKAQSLASQGKLDSKQAASLLKARKAFEQEKFLEALLLAEILSENSGNNPTGFAGLGSIPMAIIPLLIGGGALAFFRFRKKEAREKEIHRIKIERVPNEL